MGILAEPAAMVQALKLRRQFAVCELGDQYLTYVSPHRLAREWYGEMGCGRYVAIDANGRGNLNFDLNRKWPWDAHQFDLVTDFGTAEHVFNQGEVWRTVHTITRPLGYIAYDKPLSGYPGHGFYLYDESFFRDLADANGWRAVAMERGTTKRGTLLRGVFQKMTADKFVAPQQGRYRETLRRAARERQADVQEGQWQRTF